ncbi:retrovirus-related pol polyprotein from transposon TNT 1-94 [Tanacetum coccineum]
MSGIVPPIPPPLGSNPGNTGSHVTNVPAFDVEDFSSWKDRFLVYLDGLEPYLLEILENGPFVLKSSLFTSTNILQKPQKQWSHKDRCLANQDKRLKSIIISCLPNDVMKSVIKCTTTKSMWNDLLLAHKGSYDTRDTKIATLRLKFNAFKALEGEKLAKKMAKYESNSEATNSIKNDILATLYGKYNYEEGLIDQIYKSGRVGSAKKPMDKSNETCFACGKLGHFQKDCPSSKTSIPSYPSSNKTYNKPKFHSNSTPKNNQNVDNHKKDYKGKHKGLKAEIAIFTKKIDAMSKGKSEKGLVAKSFDWDEEYVSLEDEGVTRVNAFMAIA